MLPRADMLATKNPLWKTIRVFAAAAVLGFSGCQPAGPRSLLQGDELLSEGNVAEAIEKLKRATSLMPEEPRGWNLLGLAYHRAGEPQFALQAYRQALARDRSNVVSIAHYNLGCLLLEQNNPVAAADELRSFTLLTNSAAGLAKLGSAQLRLRQYDAAERSFAASLRLGTNNIEALNGIGVIHAHRGQRDAVQYFNSALQASPSYGPALLNSAVLAHQQPATKLAALQRYRDYLTARPKAPNAAIVQSLATQLEAELHAARPAITNVEPTKPALVLRTNVVPHTTNLAQTTPPSPRTTVASNARPTVAIVKSNEPAFAMRTNPVVSPTTSKPATNLPVTIVTVPTEPAPRIAVAEPLVGSTVSTPPAKSVVASNEVPEAIVSTPDEPTTRPGFFSRMNPFRSRPKPSTNETPRTVIRTTTNYPPPAESLALGKVPRYAYVHPRVPQGGNREEAQRIMQEAVRTQRAGNTNLALVNYQKSLVADPTYFDAQYNAALLALQSGELNRALNGWEMALAIDPESLSARYNFALALKQGNYAYDAVRELERIIEAKPDDSRAHLTLGNLYAQQLNERAKARAHYMKVLELEPRNPQAPAIRFWLAANP